MSRDEKRVSFRFERLDVWQLARTLIVHVYKESARFPTDERFGLTAQLRRAAVSVASNIAEGSGRNSDADFAHFLEQSYGSLMEVVAQLVVASDLGYLEEADLNSLRQNSSELAAKLVALNRSLSVSKRKIVGIRTAESRETVERQETKDEKLDPRPQTFDPRP
jgi:four helix bundle protein